MDRRDFVKLSAIGSSAAALDACGKPDNHLIRFIPEEEVVPGVATWKTSVCTQCPAGCGIEVRVMAGDAEVTREGQPGLQRRELAKKLEGNPNHPVNRGKLCAWGQAGLQVTYNPERIRFPLRRSGARGSGDYQEISWEDAISELVARLSPLRSRVRPTPLIFLTSYRRDHRGDLIERFLSALGAPPAVRFEFFDQTVLRRANELSFGHSQLPTFDLANANYVICFGADFLGTWNSPVSQSLGYGSMRQGRPGRRGKFVQVEPRMSQTGANADEWVYAKPGTAGHFALGLAHVMLREGLRSAELAREAGELIDGWSRGLAEYTPQAVAKVTGVEAQRIQRLAREMAGNTPALAIIGGAPLAQTNGLTSALAVNALNALLGGIEKPGGIAFTPQVVLNGLATPKGGYSVRRLCEALLTGSKTVDTLLIYNANPVFASPPAWRVREALDKVPFIASMGSFVDETSILSDLILPDHSYLESWLDNFPESGTPLPVASLSPPAMRPLHNTRATPDVLLEVARRLGSDVTKAMPWKNYEDMLREAFDRFHDHPGSVTASTGEQFWRQARDRGGWWSGEIKSPPGRQETKLPVAPFKVRDAEFDGDTQEYPFHFLPYCSQQYGDGTHANLPWMQEMPDAVSTAMWCAWVEINPATAERMHIKQGDLLEIASPHGKLQAPALLAPGIAPDVVAMPVGQGHENYGRYASRRGANPIKILAPRTESETDSLAWAATRVKVTPLGKEGELILFAGGLREWPREYQHR